MNPFGGSGTAKYRPQMVLLIILCSFQYASRNNYFSDIRFFPQPLITITIARCPANCINLSAIIVDLWLSKYRRKLRHDSQIATSGGTLDVFKIPSKKNTENIAVNFCPAYSNTSLHISTYNSVHFFMTPNLIKSEGMHWGTQQFSFYIHW